VDENLQQKNDTTFQILEFLINECTQYKLSSDKIIKVPFTGNSKSYDISYISSQYKVLLQKITTQRSGTGAFDIDEIQPLINDLLDGNKLKGSSKIKGDLKTIVFDSIQNSNFNISYSIKSELGAKATLVNASQQTNFIYEIRNIDDTIMNDCNNINTREKLKEKYKLLIDNGAEFDFIKIQSDTFRDNLKLIDSNLDEILAKILILSYAKNEKKIKELLSFMITDNQSEIYYNKKLKDFANHSAFGMFPSVEWNGINDVNGGIIIVTKTGKVYLLDLIYFKSIVDNYLLENIKLESASTSKFKYFKVYKEDNKYYFKLNLQIRFK